MRAFNLLLSLLMLAFFAVQYNDPDALLWMGYYSVPAIWAALMAWRREVLLQSPRWRGALWASVAAWAALMVYYWPSMPGFWRKEVWSVEESAREGMGLMIAFAVVVIVAAQVFGARRR